MEAIEISRPDNESDTCCDPVRQEALGKLWKEVCEQAPEFREISCGSPVCINDPLGIAINDPWK